MLYDRIIDIYLSKSESKVVPTVNEFLTSKDIFSVVSSKDNGLKPDISLSMKFLPNTNASDVVIKILNLSDELNIAEYTYLMVRAGYRNGLSVTYTGQIFGSYMERPNPDGITVFQLVLADMTTFFGPFEIDFSNNETVKVKDYCTKMLDSLEIPYTLRLPTEIESKEVDTNNSVLHYYNVEQLLLAVKDIIEKAQEDTVFSDIVPIVDYRNGNIKVVLADPNNAASYFRQDGAIVVDAVSSAYFNGGNAIFQMLWDPRLIPGVIVKSSLKFFRGRLGTATLAQNISQKEAYFEIYEVNTSFSTTNENTTQVTAVILGGA